MTDDMLEQQDELLSEEEYAEAPQDNMSILVIIFTTVFLLIGIGLITLELATVYDAFGGSTVKKTSTKK